MTILFVTQKSRPNLKNLLLFTGLHRRRHFLSRRLVFVAAAGGGVFLCRTISLDAARRPCAWLAGTALGRAADRASGRISVGGAGAWRCTAVGQHATNRTEVTELQPFGGDILAVIIVGALVALRMAD